jgi:hypothetical protein
MLNHKKKAATLACAFILGFSALASSTAPAQAATISSTKQGTEQWRALNGKLILVAGTYQDTTTYKRSLTFFFEEKAGAEWLHVPVIESEADHTLTWFTISSGDTTVADAVVSTQGDNIYLITAEKSSGKAGITANWYKFVATGSDFPDGPAYVFKKISSNAYAGAKVSVEDVLKKESALKAKK